MMTMMRTMITFNIRMMIIVVTPMMMTMMVTMMIMIIIMMMMVTINIMLMITMTITVVTLIIKTTMIERSVMTMIMMIMLKMMMTNTIMMALHIFCLLQSTQGYLADGQNEIILRFFSIKKHTSICTVSVALICSSSLSRFVRDCLTSSNSLLSLQNQKTRRYYSKLLRF